MAYASDILFSIDTAFQQKGAVDTPTITSTHTLTYKSGTYQIVTNGSGSPLTVMLPSVKTGVSFWIKCAGADAINVNEPAGGSTISALTTGQAALLVSDGSSWYQVLKS